MMMSPEHPRYVAKTKIGPLEVSTVKLPIDHAFGSGPPQWYETMVFGGDDEVDPADDWFGRYATREEAEAGHVAIVALVEAHNETKGAEQEA